MKTFEEAYSDYEKYVHLAQEADKVYEPLFYGGKWKNGEWVRNPMEEWLEQKQDAEKLWELVHRVLLHIFYLDNKNILYLLEKHKKEGDFNHLLITIENVRRHMGCSAFSDIYIEIEEEDYSHPYIKADFITKLFEMALELWETQFENHKDSVMRFVSQVYDIIFHHRWEKTTTTLDLYVQLSCTVLGEEYLNDIYYFHKGEKMPSNYFTVVSWVSMTQNALRQYPAHFFILWEKVQYFSKEPFFLAPFLDWWTKTYKYVMNLPTQEA